MNKTNDLRSLIIVGGGTAGWLSALYADKMLNRFSQQVEITVIDSTEVGIIGVGEATVHSIRYFLQQLDINETDFMAKTDATFKLGIRFDNWCKPNNGEVHSYWHPFDVQLASYQGFDVAELWNLQRHHGYELPFADVASMSPYLANTGRSPKISNSKPFDAPIPYAYHFDAGKAADYFRSISMRRGIKHVSDTILDVNCDKEIILSVASAEHVYQADFFIDCSGFKQLLIRKLAEGNWHSYEEELPCTQAVAIQTSYAAEQKTNLYTTATGLKYGWCWQIHLQNRIGNGYVYDPNRLSKVQAEAELRAFLAIDNSIEATHLNMNVGRCEKTWVGNCVAIGLSSGFIEPLESTGIYLIEAGLRRLFECGLEVNAANMVKNQYNQSISALYDELRDFIVLHYCLTDREDTDFWASRPDSIQGNKRLLKIVEQAQHRMITDKELGRNSCLFNQINYRFVLFGMNHSPKQPHPQLAGLAPSHSEVLLNELLTFYAKQSGQHTVISK